MPTKFMLLAGASILMLGLASPAFADPPAPPPGKEKVVVCHEPPGNRPNVQIITVGSPAAAKGHNVDGAADPDRSHLDPEEVDCDGESNGGGGE